MILNTMPKNCFGYPGPDREPSVLLLIRMTAETGSCKCKKSVRGSGYRVSRDFEAPPGAKKTRISMRFMTSEFAPGGGFDLYFGSSSGRTALNFQIARQGDTYFISHRTSGRGYGTRISEIVPNEWYQLDVEYKPAGTDDTWIVASVNGQQPKVLNEYFHGGDASKPPIQDIKLCLCTSTLTQ